MATLADEVRDRAFERLYEGHVRDVYRYVLAVLRNPADAEDVTQTTFMHAYRAFKSGERPRKPRNWLITIAHNACRTRAVRASRRPREVPLDDVIVRLAVPEQERTNVRELLRALGRLPFNQRAAIAMRELQGRSYDEIAETLGVTVPAVESLIGRARRALRAQSAALRGLAAVPLPRSLRSVLESGDLTTAGGALVGGGVLAKAAAVVVAGAVAGGVGYKTVESGLDRSHAAPRPRALQLQLAPHALPSAPGRSRVAPAAVRSPITPASRGAPARVPAPAGHRAAVTPPDGGQPATVPSTDSDGVAPEPAAAGAPGPAEPSPGGPDVVSAVTGLLPEAPVPVPVPAAPELPPIPLPAPEMPVLPLFVPPVVPPVVPSLPGLP
jgi:RNA polymerase sigma factor (sigma-70 family)